MRPIKGHTVPAFTLVELLATLFVISLLMAVLIPRFTSARHQARRSACLSHQRTLALALISYANQHNDNLPDPAAEVEVNGLEVSPREMIYRPLPGLVNLGVLTEDELPNDFSNFFCPSATLANFQQDLSLIGSGLPVAGDYVYALSIAHGQKMSVSRLGSIAILSDNYVGSNLGKEIGLGNFAHKSGYNVAFSDGSGVYIRDPKGKIAAEKVPYDDDEDANNFAELDAHGDAPKGFPTMRIYEIWHDLSFGKGPE